MALLPADPKQRKQSLILMAIVVAGAWYAAKLYLTDDRKMDIETLQEQLETLEARNGRSRALAARRDDLGHRLELYEQQLKLFEEFIPQSEEVPELLDAISREAQLTGVELSSIRPQAAETGEFYTKQTWELSVVGDYHNVGRYLARVASLPRIIKPTNLQLGPAPRSRATRNMQAPLEVSFAIETFVLGAAEAEQGSQGASSRD